MGKFIVQSSPIDFGRREFFVMDEDPRRPGRGGLIDKFLTKVGKTSESWDVVATCYDVNRAALLAAGATSIGWHGTNLSEFPGEPSPCAFVLEGWRAEALASA